MGLPPFAVSSSHRSKTYGPSKGMVIDRARVREAKECTAAWRLVVGAFNSCVVVAGVCLWLCEPIGHLD